VNVTDAKQQVYIYKCQNVTIQITGKLKSVIVDSCTKVGVVFDTAISACEVVNCKSVQVQSTNLCPSFSIDKTDGIVIHLTNAAVSQSVFVTSKSSEMNGESDICSLFAVQWIAFEMDSNNMIVSFSSLSKSIVVSWVDDDGEIKEAPIPEQFQHKLVNGSVTSQVSDLYH
jgi:adenylyl cyclase-associated protein